MTGAANTEAARAKAAFKAKKYTPSIARTHDSIDLDKDRGSLREDDDEDRIWLSPSQKDKLVMVYYLHLKELDNWRHIRRVEVRCKANGTIVGRWEPTWPRIDWERVMCSHEFALHVRPPDKVRRWVKKYARRLRKDSASGLCFGYPEWVVRCAGSACMLAVPRTPLCTRPLRSARGAPHASDGMLHVQLS